MQDYQVPNKVNTTMSGIQLKITMCHKQSPSDFVTYALWC